MNVVLKRFVCLGNKLILIPSNFRYTCIKCVWNWNGELSNVWLRGNDQLDARLYRVGQNTLRIFSRALWRAGGAVEGWGLVRKLQVVGKFPIQHSVVVKMVWSNEQRAFAVETYFSQSHCIVAVQDAFRTHYKIPPRDRKSILLWVKNFREKGNVSEKRWSRPRTSRTPENIEAVRRSVLQSPRRSARKHHANNGHHLQDILSKNMWFKTSHFVNTESKNKMFVPWIVFFVIHLKMYGGYFAHPVLYNTFFIIMILYMFRETLCWLSGGQIVLIQHLVYYSV